MSDYIICTQSIKNGQFTNSPGSSNYLKVPEDAETFTPAHKVGLSDFLSDIINEEKEDIVVFIHGYNNEDNVVLGRHRALRNGLEKQGFQGDVITFAWPSNNNALLYLEDRRDAKKTAFELVDSCIRLLVRQQKKDCKINVHLVAHSTGAYVIHEAFDDAETTEETAISNWTVSQILFISGDVSSDSMTTARGEKVYRHCQRLTNYFTPQDGALAISNVKRVGAKNRVGRIGLPEDSPSKAIDINCGEYYDANKDKLEVVGMHSHSWYLYSESWFKDAYYTIMGELDRDVIPTRYLKPNGELFLRI